MVARLRKLGTMERYSTARHSLGYYRCVALVAKYSIEGSEKDLPQILEAALAKVVLRHAHLRCGIIDEDKKETWFIRLDSIDLSQQIEYRNLDVSTGEEYELALTEIIRHQFDQLWPDLDKRPAWKVIVVRRNTPSSNKLEFDMMFAFHHAPMDGIGGQTFHKSFLEALNTPEPAVQLDNHKLTVPESTTMFPSLDDAVKWKVSWHYFLRQVWEGLRPKWLFPDRNPPWRGNICTPETVENYHTNVRAITIPQATLAAVLSLCREKKVTLTTLIHGIEATSLAKLVPSATSFHSTTPYDIRHLSGHSSKEDILNMISAAQYTFTPATLTAIRQAKTQDEIDEQIWKVARELKAALTAEIASLPQDSIVGMMPYVSSFHDLLRSRMGHPRGETFEVTNVGVFKNGPVEEGKWRIERMIFSQSGLAVGGMVNSVSSVSGGPLVMHLTWLEGAYDNEMIEQVAVDLESELKRLAGEKGKYA